MPWIRRFYKGKQKVWVKVDEEGNTILNNGMAETRFQMKEDARIYTMHPANLSNIEGAEVTAHDTTSPKPPNPDPVITLDEQGFGQQIISTTIPESVAIYPHEAPTDYIEIYTDGACQGNPGPCSYGVLVRFGPHYKEVSQYLGHGTNNIGELMGIKVALDLIKRPDLPVKIHTDSSYCIGVLTQNWKAKANKALIAQIKAQMEPFENLELIKVKGHSGHPLNDRVDELAVLAIEQVKRQHPEAIDAALKQNTNESLL